MSICKSMALGSTSSFATTVVSRPGRELTSAIAVRSTSIGWLADGRQAVVHVEEIYDTDPFARCDELMRDYGVQVCAVEQLPNFNDALRFANRWPGRVFLANYGDLKDETMRWGDAPKLDASARRTSEEDRSRYTVTVDQYKCMSLALSGKG